MSGERKLVYLILWFVGCVFLVIVTPVDEPGHLTFWGTVGGLGMTGIFGEIILILLAIQGWSVGRTTRNIKKEWHKNQ